MDVVGSGHVVEPRQACQVRLEDVLQDTVVASKGLTVLDAEKFVRNVIKAGENQRTIVS